MVFKNQELHLRKDKNWLKRSIEDNTTRESKRLDLMINQQFFYSTEATLLKLRKQIEEPIWLASGLHNAKIKLTPPHTKIIVRQEPEISRGIYAGQTSRHVTTRISEHEKKDSKVSQHHFNCGCSTNDFEWQILDAFRILEKSMTIEDEYTSKLKPGLYSHFQNFNLAMKNRAENFCKTIRNSLNSHKRYTMG